MDSLGDLESILLNYAQDKVAVLDDDGSYTYVNAAVERLLGFEPDELVGTNAFDYIHPDDVSRVRARFAEIVTANHGFVDGIVEYRHRGADGEYVWLESRCSNYTDDRLGGYIVSSRDVTDRVEAERERDESAVRLAELAGQTSDVLWVFTGDWSELLFINDAYAEVYGGDVEELLGDPSTFLDCVHPEDADAVREAMTRLSRGDSVDMEYRVDARRNYNTWAWIQAEPIIEDGDVVRIVGFTRDVTERRRRERQLVVIDNILRHNLRNDMNTILGYADLITEDPSSGPENAEIIRQVGEALLETAEKQRDINELFTSPIRLETLDLRTAIDDAVGQVVEAYPRAEIRVDAPKTLPARAVPQIEVAVLELVENAVKHAGVEAPSVEVHAGTTGDRVTVEVRDECPPIPASEYRVLTGTSEMNQIYHSTGLGLWLAYWMTDLSDGHIEFEPRADVGNVVTISLPLPAEALDDEA